MKATITRGVSALVTIGLAAWLGPGLVLAGNQEQPPKVVNLTESFQVVSVERRDSEVVLRVKNASSKYITAYSLSIGTGIMQTDFGPNLSKRGLAPGETEGITIPLAGKEPLTIDAVVFEDGSSEGDFQQVARITAHRAGDRFQLQRIQALITKACGSPELAIKSLKQDISSLEDVPPSGGNSPAFRAGMSFARQWALKTLDHLEAGDLDIQIRVAPNYDAQRAVLPDGKLRLGLELINDQVTKQLARY